MEQVLVTLRNQLPLFLGLCGTILSIISLLLQWLKYKNDRAIIRVKVTNGLFTGSSDSNVKFFIEVINLGNKSIKLTSVGIRLSNNKNMIIPHPAAFSFPHILQGNDSVLVDVDRADLLDYLKLNNVKIKFVWISDATNREYTGKFPRKFM